MRDAVEAVADAAHEELAAPDRAVVAVAGAVEADADHALVPCAALGEHRRDVRAMMLHGRDLAGAEGRRERRRAYSGWASRDHEQLVGAHLVHGQQVADRLLERAAGVVVSRSPMCWLTNAWPSTTSVTVFLRSAPSASTAGRRHRGHGAGRIAAGAPQDHGAQRPEPHDGVVDPAGDRPLAHEEPSASPARRSSASRPRTRSARSTGWRWS